MGRVERIFVYSLLGILLCATFGRGLETLDNSAVATQPRAKDTLGPADEIVFNGEKPLVVVNREGRIGWGERATSSSWAVASVNLSGILPEMLQRESFQDEMKDLEELQLGQNAEFENAFKALQDEYGEIGQEDPKFAEAQARAQEIMARYNEWQQGAMQVRGKKTAEQLEKAYRDVIEAIEVVSDEQEIDVVFRFVPTATEFRSESPDAAADQIRLRTFLRYPEAMDITESVRDELGL
jgi:Skp family chaperone for outer membrane proteins